MPHLNPRTNSYRVMFFFFIYRSTNVLHHSKHPLWERKWVKCAANIFFWTGHSGAVCECLEQTPLICLASKSINHQFEQPMFNRHPLRLGLAPTVLPLTNWMESQCFATDLQMLSMQMSRSCSYIEDWSFLFDSMVKVDCECSLVTFILISPVPPKQTTPLATSRRTAVDFN